MAWLKVFHYKISYTRNRSSPVIELKGATLKFFKGIPSSASESSLRPQFAKLEQWQPFEIWGQNTIFGGHYLAVFEITAFFSALSQLFCFPTKPVTKLVFRDFFKYQRTLFYMYFPDQSKSCPIKLEFASTKGRWECSQENWESLRQYSETVFFGCWD